MHKLRKINSANLDHNEISCSKQHVTLEPTSMKWQPQCYDTTKRHDAKGKKAQKSHTQLKPSDPATNEKVSEQSSNPYFKKGTLKQQIEINDLFARYIPMQYWTKLGFQRYRNGGKGLRRFHRFRVASNSN